MKSILIKDNVIDLAEEYKDEVTRLPKLRNELDNLEKELSVNKQPNASEYVHTIKENLGDILTWMPDDYDSLHTNMFAEYDSGGLKAFNLSDRCKLKDLNNTVHDRTIYMHIVNALQYDVVQEKIFPKYAIRLGIRSCVYCNAQFSVSSKKGKTDRGTRYWSTYTIDHCKPKCEFPYLATAFYNLYPCCSPCNQAKSKRPAIWNLYIKPGADINPYEFKIEDQSYLDYLVDRKYDKLNILFRDKVTKLTPQKYDNYFHITKLYNNFKPEVEEVIWRKMVYNEEMITSMKDSGVFDLNSIDVNRFIIGNYDKEDDILRKPLAKLMQDIAKQLGLI